MPVAAVNARFLQRPVTGVERYAVEVTRRLEGHLRVVRAPPMARGLKGHLWEQLVLPRALHRDELLWSPANSGPLAIRNQVVTIYDASPLDHPEWFHRGFARLFRLLLPRLVRRARRIITVSRFSRDRLLEVEGADPNRVVVILPGVDGERFRPPPPERVEAVRRRHSLPEQYLLALGSRSPRKNVPVLTSAWQLLRRGHPELGLVVAGGPTPTAAAMKRERSEEGIRILGRVPEADLPALYGGAAAFVYPSLYEGFGLPVLEAMACGTPVVASSRTGIPEAVGGAGVLFDPVDPEALASAIDELLRDVRHRRLLVARGLERARELTWERTARAVLETLTEPHPRAPRTPRTSPAP